MPKISDRMTPMSVNAKRLGTAVLARRKELDLNQRGVADAGGPSDTTLSKLENGAVKVVSSATLRRLDAGLDWASGTARAIYEGRSKDATVHAPAAMTTSARLAKPDWMDDDTYRDIMDDVEDYFRFKLAAAKPQESPPVVIVEASELPLERAQRAAKRRSRRPSVRQ